jgi:hypothetical protein
MPKHAKRQSRKEEVFARVRQSATDALADIEDWFEGGVPVKVRAWTERFEGVFNTMCASTGQAQRTAFYQLFGESGEDEGIIGELADLEEHFVHFNYPNRKPSVGDFVDLLLNTVGELERFIPSA